MPSQNEDEDEDMLFGKYIAQELKHIQNFREKQRAKLKIQNIICDAQVQSPAPENTVPPVDRPQGQSTAAMCHPALNFP